jgi:hypothetical protein
MAESMDGRLNTARGIITGLIISTLMWVVFVWLVWG